MDIHLSYEAVAALAFCATAIVAVAAGSAWAIVHELKASPVQRRRARRNRRQRG